MNWISRMIQRGNTVSAEDAAAAIHAFNEAAQHDEVANSVSDKPLREAHWRQKANDTRRHAYALSQGLDMDTLLELAQGAYDEP